MARIQITTNPSNVPFLPKIRIGQPAQSELYRHKPLAIPQLQVFFSGKGGSGTSFLAATMAGVQRMLTQKKVLLVDLDLLSNGIQPFTGLESARTILDLKPVITELTENHIRNAIQTDPITGMDILAGSTELDPTQAFPLLASEVLNFLQEAKKYYDVIAIDAGSKLSPLSMMLFQNANRIHYVLTLDTPSLRAYHQILSTSQQFNLTLDNLYVILNRVDKANDIQSKDLKGIQPMRIEGTIRADFLGIQSHVNLGIPLASRFHEKKPPIVLRDIMRTVQEMTRWS